MTLNSYVTPIGAQSRIYDRPAVLRGKKHLQGLLVDVARDIRADDHPGICAGSRGDHLDAVVPWIVRKNPGNGGIRIEAIEVEWGTHLDRRCTHRAITGLQNKARGVDSAKFALR